MKNRTKVYLMVSFLSLFLVSFSLGQEKEIADSLVQIRIDIIRDIESFPPLPFPKVTLTNLQTKQVQIIQDGSFVSPGKYELDIEQKGYSYGTSKTITISKCKEYHLREKLIKRVKSYGRYFHITEEGAFTPFYEVTYRCNGKKVSNALLSTFKEGDQVEVTMKFLCYATIIENYTFPSFPPIKIKLEKLKRYEFTSPFSLDSIFADKKEIEPHHVIPEKGFARYYYTVWVPPEAKFILVRKSYLCWKTFFSRLRLGVLKEMHIDLEILLEHLKKLYKKDNDYGSSLDELEKIMSDDQQRKAFLRIQKVGREKLLECLSAWDLRSEEEKIRLRKMVCEISSSH